MSALDTVAATRQVAASPYVGLSYYTEEDADLFFGRDSERKIITGNLRASRLTLLYAPSGVGKSSLLRAGVAARLGQAARRGDGERGPSRYIPIVFSSWRDDPVGQLVERTAAAVAPFAGPGAQPPPPAARLDEAIEAATAAVGATLLFILDQFEEYFLYRSRETHQVELADELARCINRANLRANFLIAIREDAYSGLGDLFQGRISNVYGNYLHLAHLDRAAGREAITKPVERFNELHEGDEPFTLEPELVESVLDQVRTDQVVLGHEGVGKVAGADGRGAHDEIEAPYLQLVMARLWREEQKAGSHVLRLATLEGLHGAQEIIRTHLDDALDSLSEPEQEVAAAAFRQLVTRSGAKIAYALTDLADLIDRPAEEVRALLEKLEQGPSDRQGAARIVRVVPSPPGVPGPCYEIFHDVLAQPILAWRARQAEARLRRAKEEAERKEQRERKRTRVFAAIALVAVAVGTTLALTLRAPGPAGPPATLSASKAVAVVAPDSLAESLLRNALPVKDLPAGVTATSPTLELFRQPNLVATTTTSLSSSSNADYSDVFYEVFNGVDAARNQYSLSDELQEGFVAAGGPFTPAQQAGLGAFAKTALTDPARCQAGHQTTSSPRQWESVCEVLSNKVVTYVTATSYTKSVAANDKMATTLAADAIWHLKTAAAATPRGAPAAPPGSTRATALWGRLMHTPLSPALVPYGLGSSNSFTPQSYSFGSSPPAGLVLGRIQFSLLSSDYPFNLKFYVFGSSRQAQAWFGTNLHPTGSSRLAVYDSSGFQQPASCAAYHFAKLSSGDGYPYSAACYVLSGDVVVATENYSELVPTKAEEDLSAVMAWAGVMQLDFVDRA